MRASWLLFAMALATLSVSVSALKLEQQKELSPNDRNGHTGLHPRRRNKLSGASTGSRRPQLRRGKDQQGTASEEDEDEGYDWIDVDTSAAEDSSQMAPEPNAASSAPRDIFTCCNQVFGSCRTACENLSLVQLDYGSGREEPRTELRKYCQLHQLEFWSCVNRTLEAVDRGKSWSGRRCCQLAVLPKCKNSCATAAASQEVTEVCRRSDEQVLYDCFEHQEAADSCCGQARTSECLQACREVFEPPNETGTGNGDGKLVDETCGERNADVLQCIHNHTDMTPPLDVEKYLPCCEYSREEKCHHTCTKVLQASKLHQQKERSDVIFARLEAGCGMPLPHLPFWQCFLTATRKLYVPAGAHSQRRPELASNGAEEPNKLGIDSAKRQCCEQANSHKCRRLCTQIFTNGWWETRVSFDTECLEQPAELDLRRCIESVDAPCELGCHGLSFCTNFNNRPTQLFRSCSTAHDAAAREDLLMLQQRGFIRVLGQELFIKNTTRCAPDKWQALVCALQLQPCTRVGLYNGICREDCTELLDECLDWTRQPQRPQAICDRLQPPTAEDEEPMPCLSLRTYLKGIDTAEGAGTELAVNSPCASKPCNVSEACVLQRNGRQGYSCIPGCSLGQASALIVPFGAYVRVGKTRNPNGGLASAQLSAEHVVCRCGLRGNVDQCQPLPSYIHSNCVLPGGRSFSHGSSFHLECNLCSCFAGEITCTKQQCRLAGYVDAGYTSLPCNCPAHYVPVCGFNGNTYPSACVAKCLGLMENSFVYGACNARNACQGATGGGSPSCPSGTQCLERRQICLSSMQRPCPQYICVNVSASSCGTQHTEELCDTEGKTHPNACSLLQTNSQLAYWGACRPEHDTGNELSPVCGINGVTYRSRSAALSEFVHVDYVGRCREVGLLVSDMGRRCRTVQCPSPVSKHCHHIVPPGACCPMCGGAAFRIIYSRKQLDRAYYALRGQQSSLLTLRGILQELDHLVQVSDCQLTGFLTMEVGIFVALVPRGRPTLLQLKVCEAEAEKISSLISSQSPRITTNLALSSLSVSHMLEPTMNGAALVSPHGFAILAIGLLSLAHLRIGRNIDI
ncbi:reversion-inducing cysteine-rich protein with Kazal motifs isoform X1 [Drosophila novamexicana]|uniref:reversion-inducing cysteine-rich protein with Kazal motifs isoform X1 n=1 Tax=Drosophila novamexicana TaxID=47314 RepID=UPI0011E5CC74|nr:reversion-inducing cysteine-rich protein with Kazal motifs isoform X1 [Drosophila novamexicana]XP_030571060.1 reversion-inducing cysteine-rich protein with Kazal motifs isoform X1 [Drosophila novamexicana]XP_030571061.1 reversion-inducing cysteine-rich protein with Kazal motifs isoform X1 [Drosophila novamexicana]XP_030571062.1 reversion-inducing cysteine-rich protein with Kazal motifs isoform X1 [Drosophila novamexicana]